MTDAARGLFGLSSISVRVRSARRHAIGPIHRHATMRMHGTRGLRIKAEDEAIDWITLPAEERLALLTALHENDHFSRVVETPLGLLLWRCHETLLDDTALLLRELEACGIRRFPPGKHLVDWFREDGERFLDEAEAAGRLPRAADWLRMTSGSSPDILRAALRGAAYEIEVLERFVKIVFGEGRPQISMEEFIDLADAAYRCLSRRWNLPLHVGWRTRYPLSYPLYPKPDVDWSVTIPEMFEASARLRERGLLEGAKADAAEIEAWERENVVGVYKHGYDFLMGQLGYSEAAHLIARLSLTSPIDIACLRDPRERWIYLENVLPAFRAARLVKAYGKLASKLDDDPGLMQRIGQIGLPDVLCEFALLRSATDTLETAMGSGIAPLIALKDLTERDGSASETPRQTGGPYDYRRYTRAIIKKFEVGMRQNLHYLLPEGRIVQAHLAAASPFIDGEHLQQAMEDKEGNFPIQPDITFYSDLVTLNSAYRGADVFTYADNMVHYVATQVCHGLLSPLRAVQDPEPLMMGFISRLRSSAEEMDLGDLADTPLGRALKAEHEAEQGPEWRSLRATWGSVDESRRQLWAYLRTEFGDAAINSIRLYD